MINGSEKVLIAQERQAYNRVYCFKRKAPSKSTWTAEIRSDVGSLLPLMLPCLHVLCMCVCVCAHALGERKAAVNVAV